MDHVAPSLFQMFSPMRSPFYGMLAGAMIAILTIAGKPLAAYGAGLMVMVTAIALYGALFIGIQLSDFQYNFSILHARTVGIVGGLISIATLIASHKVVQSDVFHMCWTLCLVHVFSMLATLFLKSRDTLEKAYEAKPSKRRFNVVQYSLVNAVLLTALSRLSSHSDAQLYDLDNLLASFLSTYALGAWVTLISPFSVLGGYISASTDIVAALVFLTTTCMAVGSVKLIMEVELGRKDQMEEISYNS